MLIHARCVNTIKEFTNYSYKVDPKPGDVITQIIDAHNHSVDAIRYAIERIMKRSTANYRVLPNPANYNFLLRG